MLLRFCPAIFGVQFCSFVLGCRYTTGVCLSVTLHIVDLWQYCACSTVYMFRYNLKHPFLFYTWAVCTSAGYIRCFGHPLVHLCTSSLQNLAVLQDFYFAVSITVEWSCWPRIWWCGTGRFQDSSQCLLLALLLAPFLSPMFFLSLLSFHGLVLWGWGLQTLYYYILLEYIYLYKICNLTPKYFLIWCV